ncbi:MAG TPA: MerR family transcriptional regulator [Sedimenticola thiotaurini]|uniref:MerR family transcriptional regulator n=1 Tax=Sedimenticola thiotaurini TaxID=1543721 RepID=A0A831W5Y3_9GAMM|nr:MerR family transcriptional regulator [Sedimenticola thiotaurini]
MNTSKEILTGLLLDEEVTLSLGELSRACAVHAEWIVELVQEGVLEPSGADVEHWRFGASSLRRARTVRHLQRDLGVNLAGAALALDLMDELQALRDRLAVLDRSC